MMIDSDYLVVYLVLLGPFGRRFESFPWKPLPIKRIERWLMGVMRYIQK